MIRLSLSLYSTCRLLHVPGISRRDSCHVQVGAPMYDSDVLLQLQAWTLVGAVRIYCTVQMLSLYSGTVVRSRICVYNAPTSVIRRVPLALRARNASTQPAAGFSTSSLQLVRYYSALVVFKLSVPAAVRWTAYFLMAAYSHVATLFNRRLDAKRKSMLHAATLYSIGARSTRVPPKSQVKSCRTSQVLCRISPDPSQPTGPPRARGGKGGTKVRTSSYVPRAHLSEQTPTLALREWRAHGWRAASLQVAQRREAHASGDQRARHDSRDFQLQLPALNSTRASDPGPRKHWPGVNQSGKPTPATRPLRGSVSLPALV